jgi:hypothetical protein
MSGMFLFDVGHGRNIVYAVSGSYASDCFWST